MKYSVVRFKSLEICIKELEPFIKDGEHLQTGKGFIRFENLRSRELLANWLLCVVLNFEQGVERFSFFNDPNGGDGIIYDVIANKSYPTEHILVPRQAIKHKEIQTLILEAIEKKQNKGGLAYASGKTLIVFLNADGEWNPNKIAKNLPNILDFKEVWIVGLQRIIQEEYVYNITRLDAFNSPIWLVNVAKTFDEWRVKRVQ